MERRLRPRKKVAVSVYLSYPGQRTRRCKASNLSSGGVFVETEALDFPKNTPLQLFFALHNPNSSVVRVHRVSAIVVRFSSKGVGMMFCGSIRHSRQRVRQRIPRTRPETEF